MIINEKSRRDIIHGSIKQERRIFYSSGGTEPKALQSEMKFAQSIPFKKLGIHSYITPGSYYGC